MANIQDDHELLAKDDMPPEQRVIISRLRLDYNRPSFAPRNLLPCNLYHYTSAAGLFGILDSGILRASNFSFLNDAAEMRYGEDVVSDVLTEYVTATDGLVHMGLDVAAGTLKKIGSEIEFYLACFCTESNLLSQWRGYGTGTGRFCIGFKAHDLCHDTLAPQNHFGRVEYVRDQQVARVKEVIDGAVHAFEEVEKLDAKLQKGCMKGVCNELFLRLVREMCLFKHPGFSEEKEWRAVHWLEDQSKIQFERPRGDSIRPFINLFTGNGEPKRLPITEVIVGSSSIVQQSKKSVELLLNSRGYTDVTVSDSGIPFRDL